MRRSSGERGSAALEVALSLPAVALVVLMALQGYVWCRDALLAQEAARAAGRVAATTTSPSAPREHVTALLPGRGATTAVVGAHRPGGLLRVTVRMPTRSLLGGVVVGETVVAVEPRP